MPAPRSLASLTISFGLVAIPVKVYSSTIASEHVSFHLVRASDGSRLKQQYVAVNDGKEVDRAHITKAYETAKGKRVVFTPSELKDFEEATTHTVSIEQFVPLDSVDPLYYHGTFYLAPDKGSLKPYSLLNAALDKMHQCAVGRWVFHGKESVVVIRPLGAGLALHQLRFHEEVRDVKELGIKRTPVSVDELKLAEQLIENLAAKAFNPNRYDNQYKRKVDEAVRRKQAGHEFVVQEAPPPAAGNVVDLMAALKASLGRRSTGSSGRNRKGQARTLPKRFRKTG